MKKLLARFLALYIALFPLAPAANAAAKFLIACATTCTWDNTNDTIWSTSSGGANNTTHPVAGDDVTLDASSCSGGTTCTITTFAGTISAASITSGTCTASTTGCIVAANTNNTNFTLAASSGTMFSTTGTGTRKWVAGTGTYTLTRSSGASYVNTATTTNDQGSVFSTATWVLSGTTANGGSFNNNGNFAFGPTTINGNSSGGSINVLGTMTFASLTVNSPSYIQLPIGVTTTITGALTLTGTSSSSVVTLTNPNPDPANGVPTISLGAASTGTWNVLGSITTAGAAALTSSNCITQRAVTLANGGACNAPSGGGGGRGILGSGF